MLAWQSLVWKICKIKKKILKKSFKFEGYTDRKNDKQMNK